MKNEERPDEAKIVEGPHGKAREGKGWFVMNADEVQWLKSDRFGTFTNFDGDTRFEQIGIGIHVLAPGQAACMYHRENEQEDFLILSGECRVIIEEQERALRPWDFVHCPPGTTHVFVGGDKGPCAILMVGRRSGETELLYPVSELARKYGASVEVDTPDPRKAYEGVERPVPAPFGWPLTRS